MSLKKQPKQQDNSAHAFPWRGDATTHEASSEPNQPSPPQPAKQSGQQIQQSSRRFTLKALTTVIVIVIGLVSLLFSILFATGVFGTLSYDELTRSSTTADSTENISVLHPAEMEAVFVGSSKLEFIHRGEDGRGMIAELAVDSAFFGPDTAQAAEELSAGLLDEGSDVYRTIFDDSQIDLDSVRNMSYGSFSVREAIDSSVNQTFVADLTYQIPFIDDQSEYVDVVGKLLYVVGEEKIFTVRITALESVWNNNQAIFTEMVESVQIEQ